MGAKSNAKPPPPKVVMMLDKALKLADAWVNNMSTSGACDQNEVDIEGPSRRLGLGARIMPKAKTAVTLDPVERKLLGKLNSKKKSLSDNVETNLPKHDATSEDDSEPESRTRAFLKKRPIPQVPLQSIKRKR